VYANDIDRGLDVFDIRHRSLRGAESLDRNNPQTQEFLFEGDRSDRPSRKFGTFTTLPAGAEMGLDIGGVPRIRRGSPPCSAENPAAGTT
jgi:hypothetical protein